MDIQLPTIRKCTHRQEKTIPAEMEATLAGIGLTRAQLEGAGWIGAGLSRRWRSSHSQMQAKGIPAEMECTQTEIDMTDRLHQTGAKPEKNPTPDMVAP